MYSAPWVVSSSAQWDILVRTEEQTAEDRRVFQVKTGDSFPSQPQEEIKLSEIQNKLNYQIPTMTIAFSVP